MCRDLFELRYTGERFAPRIVNPGDIVGKRLVHRQYEFVERASAILQPAERQSKHVINRQCTDDNVAREIAACGVHDLGIPIEPGDARTWKIRRASERTVKIPIISVSGLGITLKAVLIKSDIASADRNTTIDPFPICRQLPIGFDTPHLL